MVARSRGAMRIGSVHVDRRAVAAAGAGAAHQQQQRNDGKGKDEEQPEGIDVRDHRRLPRDLRVEHRDRRRRVEVERGGQQRIVRPDALDQSRVHGRAVADADVTGQREHRRAFVAVARIQRREGDRGQRHEDETGADALDEARDDHQPLVHTEREARHDVQRKRGDGKADKDQQARVDRLDQPADDDHRDQRADAARRGDEPGQHHRIAHQCFQHRRQQRQHAEQHGAEEEAEDRSGQEVAILEHADVDERAAGSQCVDDEQIAEEHAQRRLQADFGRAEPVLGLTAIEHQLDRTNRQRQHREAEQVEPRSGSILGFGQKRGQAGKGERADRQIDVEDPAPRQIVGQPPAQRRADDRPQDRAHPPYRHGRAVAFGRVDIEQDRLAHRHQRRAEHALQQAEADQLAQAVGDAAQAGDGGEADDRPQHQPLAPEPPGQPAGQRGHDRGGDDVGGEHPGDLLARGGDAALDMRQRDVGDRAVERVHHRRRHHRSGDEAPRYRVRIGAGHRAAASPPNRRRR
ncbi:hypothetical protein WR25_16387 [Diploscapter pachys]|uniref:Uncharacterized protein n=1 Tax=Diploscapter pachys TaxID=2018661 RepID=A0A2A2K969_9BILA|nr:hypothetical protein WR25_16387 [Diploscapter pachys]